ncbi:hypothetical protein BDY24DRAFT_128425 [Mrakia frigida]|uniref:uncharacterized protein n=1 Tax=Mrakia frigida TaxID=29902 RepID=UPI003FCC204D
MHPPPPNLSSLSPPPSPTLPSPLPLPVTDATPTRDRTSSVGASSIGGLDDAVKALASKMLDRERMDVWKGWLGRKRDREVVKDLVEGDVSLFLSSFVFVLFSFVFVLSLLKKLNENSTLNSSLPLSSPAPNPTSTSLPQLPTLLQTFTHPSSRQTLLDLLRSDRPDWVGLPLSTSELEKHLETEEEREEGRRAREGEGLVKKCGSGIGIGIDG